MAQTRTRTFPDGDYPQRLKEAWAALDMAVKDEAKGNDPELYAGEDSPVEQLAAAYKDLKAEADADAEEKRRVVTLRGVGRRAWRDLKEKHPPRTAGDGVDPEDVKGDRTAGVNTDTVGDDLLYASVTHPDFTSRPAFDEWLDEWSEGEYQTLLQDAWALANTAVFDPKSLPASLSQRSDTN